MTTVEKNPETRTTDDGHIDWSVLDQLMVLQKPGAPDLRLRLMTIFLRTSPPLMEGIRNAISTSDAHLLTTSAHTLKTTCLSLGAMKLGGLCAELEQLGRNNSFVNADELLKQAEGQYAAVTASFRDALEKSDQK